MSNDLRLFTHIAVNNNAAKTLFLLHGTGGSEKDFLFLDQLLNKTYNLVGIKGNVDEQGMCRFFRRIAEGIFDQQSIRTESTKLAAFIAAWVKINRIAIDDSVFLGYSNGANMLLSTLFLYPRTIKKAVLLHPMLPMNAPAELSVAGKHIFVSFGTNDSIVSPTESMNVVGVLKSHGAKMEVHEYERGHELGSEEIQDVIAFLQ